jgi:DNA-binding NarL/FixJ family response regulator
VGHFFDAARSAPLQSLSTIQQINSAVIYKPANHNTAPGRKAEITKRRETAADRRERISELSAQGLTVSTIADKLGIHPRTVQKAREAAGLTTPVRHATEDERLEAKRLLVDGASYEEVARTLKRASSTIAAWHPGFQFTDAQKGLAGAMARRMSRLERQKHL